MKIITERTYLLPVTLTETDAGDFLHAMDDAYNRGQLPSDMSWGEPAPADLPKGWKLTDTGAASSTALVRITDRGLIRIEGDVPESVMTAVLHRRARG